MSKGNGPSDSAGSQAVHCLFVGSFVCADSRLQWPVHWSRSRRSHMHCSSRALPRRSWYAQLFHVLLAILMILQSTPRPHTHPSLPSLTSALRTLVGDRIASEGTPEALGPVVICVTGYVSPFSLGCQLLTVVRSDSTGKVSQGALDLLAELPIQRVSVEELPQLVRDPGQ